MLQAIIDGQRALKEELKKDINGVKDGLSNTEKSLKQNILRVEKKVDKNGKRLDKLGKQLAYLEDDTPTAEEFENLEGKVDKLVTQIAPV